MYRRIAASHYDIGTDETIGFAPDLETPMMAVTLSAFEMAEAPVTNQEFADFVAATQYVTVAEQYGWSFVFHYFLTETQKQQSPLVPGLTWWYAVEGADWCHPEGPDSHIEARMDHPVVHVAYADAVAYCEWAGVRLPTEAEWEVAAKGGTSYTRYPWGEQLKPDGQYRCNIWQGEFPALNTQADGFVGTAPVTTYEPNGYGLYQMIGNVWEWCCNPSRIPLTQVMSQSSDAWWQVHPQDEQATYAVRGGSFLCHESYCNRYRIAARNGSAVTSSASNLSFRCVRDVQA